MSVREEMLEMLGGGGKMTHGHAWKSDLPGGGGVKMVYHELPAMMNALARAGKKGDEKTVRHQMALILSQLGVVMKNVGLEAESVTARKLGRTVMGKQ